MLWLMWHMWVLLFLAFFAALRHAAASHTL